MQALEETFIVKASETDFKNHIKISSLFNYLQDIASAHAARLNVGFKDLSDQNLLWVLYWIRLEINKYPGFAEPVKIKTWPKGRFKLNFLRDFYIYNAKDEIIARAGTGWVLLRADTKRLADLTNFRVDFKYLTENAVSAYPGKIKFNRENISPEIFIRRISYSDIDINQHANNSRYIQFIFDCFKEKFFEKNIKNITVNFLAESKFGDELEISVYSSDNSVFAEIKNLTKNKIVLQSLIEIK